MKKYIKILFASFLILVFSGCEDFLDINDDPNSPTTALVSQLMPSVQVRLAAALGMGGLSGTSSLLMQQIVTRGNLNDFIIANNTGAGVWNTLYQDCLTDLNRMQSTAEEKGYTAYTGVAKILKGYIFSVLVDYWGDVPFSQAGLGSGNPTPTFDKDEDIYDGIFDLIDEGIADLHEPVTFQIRDDDLIYGGSLTKWERFANTLKLKLYNQIRLTRNVGPEVNALLTGNMLLNSIANDFELDYGSSSNPENRNPSYAGQYAAGSKTSPNPYFFEVLNGVDNFGHGGNVFSGILDPRIPYYFYKQLAPGEAAQNPTAYRSGGFVSIYSFSFNIDPNEGFDQSSSATVMGLYPIGGRYDDNAVDGTGKAIKAINNGYGQTPQRMLTYFDQKFIEAELAWAGVTGGNAGDLLEVAIAASFAKVNEVASAAGAPLIQQNTIEDYVADIRALYDAADNDGRLQIIMTQKWIASFGYAVDSFTDWRRTGWPKLHDGNTDNLNVTVRTRDFVTSLVYPDNEILLNPKAPAQRNPYLSKVFWDN